MTHHYREQYVPLSVRYYMDPDIAAAGEEAELLYLRGLALCGALYGDGYLTRSAITRGAGIGLTRITKRIESLTENGLWIPAEDGRGFTIRSWSKWNRSREEMQTMRQRDAARKRAERAGVSQPGRPSRVRVDSERTPSNVPTDNGRRSDGIRPVTTETGIPPGHYVSGVESPVGDARAREAAGDPPPPDGRGAPAPPEPGPKLAVPCPPEVAAELRATLARRRSGKPGGRP